MGDHLEIRPGGKLIRVYWSGMDTPEDEEPRWLEEDLSDVGFSHLFDECRVAEGVVLRDILLLVQPHLDLYEAILRTWCEAFVEEGLKPAPDKKETEVEYLRLYWQLSINTKWVNDQPTDQKMTNVSSFPWLDGVGFLQPDGTRTNYAISFTKTNELAGLPIKLDPVLRIVDEELEHELFMKGRSEEKSGSEIDFSSCKWEFPNPTFSLGDILYGIFYELSFYGPPERRDEKEAEIVGRVAGWEAGKIKPVAFGPGEWPKEEGEP